MNKLKKIVLFVASVVLVCQVWVIPSRADGKYHGDDKIPVDFRIHCG